MDSSDRKVLRCDGRHPNEMRRINIEHGVSENQGFIVLSHGNTRVRTSIAPAKDRAQLNINIKFSDVSRNEPMNERRIYEMRSRIAQIFSPLVSFDNQIEVNIEVKQDDGSLFSTIINSVTLCLCYSGVCLKDMCLSVTLNDCVDLCSEEESKSYQLCLVLSSCQQKILFLECSGKCQRGMLESAMETGMRHCANIHSVIREYLDRIAV